MNPSSIYTDGTYASKNPAFGSENADWKINFTLDACKALELPHNTIAEVGCGGGSILAGISKNLCSRLAVGYEPMPEAYREADKHTDKHLNFENRAIKSGELADFDLVLCYDVIEHIEDCFSFVRGMKGLGRNFLFHFPLDMNAQMVARGGPMRMVRNEVGHIHYFSKDSALSLLEECGFTVQHHSYTFGADGCYTGFLYRLMKLPRKILFSLFPDHTVRILGGFSLLVWAKPEN